MSSNYLVSLGQSAGLGGDAWKNAYKYVCRGIFHQPLEILGNDIWATGLDLRTGLPLQTHRPDEGSQDPETAAADRPDNWQGDVVPVGWNDATMTTTKATDRCATTLFNHYTRLQEMAAWDSDFLVRSDGAPVWRSGQVRIMAVNGTSYETYFVRSFNGRFLKSPKPADPAEYRDWAFAEFVYVGQRLLPYVAPQPSADDQIERILDLWRADSEDAAALDAVLQSA
jgi:hypothetical protein